jgi:hypothetical protein
MDVGARIRSRVQNLERWGDKVDGPTLRGAEDAFETRQKMKPRGLRR